MAPKRANPIEVPPAASSGEEEDEEEVSSSDDDEEEEQGSSTEEKEEDLKTQSTPFIENNPPPQKPEESGSESDSDSYTAKPNAKPIATKPMVSPVKDSPPSKRLVESDQEVKEAKRPKKTPGEEVSISEVKKPGGEDAKKQLFQRLFSEEDEIALLKGMLDYSAKKGADPCADMNAFYDFVKKSIHTDVTKAQVMDKIRRLKKKFENNAGKGKKGEDRTFSKAHEYNAFELSKKIWGKEGISGKVESSIAKSNGKAKGNKNAVAALKAELTSSPNKKLDGGVLPMEVDTKKASPKNLGSIFDKGFGVASLEEEIVKRGLNMVDGEKKAALEAKWRNFQIRELELFVERSEMVNDLAKSMLKAYKSEDK